MSRGAAAAAAAAWRAMLSSASRNPLLGCRQGGGASEALLSPEKNELRKVRWLAASASTTKEPILHRSTSTLPRRVGASSGLEPALSIHEWKANRRSFAAEPVTKEEKENQKEKEGGKDGVTGSDPTSSTSSSSSSSSTSSPISWRSAGWSLDSCATLPNAISAARALSAPFLFQAITRGDWELAGALLAFGAASDWADGASARFLDARRRRKKEITDSSPSSSASSSSSSPLGTYLDPLADKVFIGAAVAAAAGWGGGDGGAGVFAGVFEGGGDDGAAAVAAGGGEKGEEERGDRESLQGGHGRRWPLLPSWLAAAVIGRDVFLVAGSLFARLRQFQGGRWPGGPEFFRLVDEKKGTDDENGEKSSTTRAAPRVRPLFVSKLNTALQFATVGAAVADSGGWLEEGIERARRAAAATGGGEEGGAAAAAAEAAAAAFASNLSGSDVVAALAAATAAMTAVSGWAYASAYLKAKRREK